MGIVHSASGVFSRLQRSEWPDGETHKAKFPWYAVRTRSHQERIVGVGLGGKGYEQYAPFYRVPRNWSDRVVNTELPLFPGYVFCRFDHQQRLPIKTTFGVVSIVGFGNDPAPIPDNEIEAIRSVLQSGLFAEPHPFLREGQGIRVTRGALKDLEGILVKKKTNWRLVISIAMLHRSVSVEIDYDSISIL